MRIFLAAVYFISYLSGFAGIALMLFLRNDGKAREQDLYRLFLLSFFLYVIHKNSGFFCSSFLGFTGFDTTLPYFVSDMVIKSLLTAAYAFFYTSMLKQKPPTLPRYGVLAVSFIPLILMGVTLLLPDQGGVALRIIMMKAGVLLISAVLIYSSFFFQKVYKNPINPNAGEMMKYTVIGNLVFVIPYTAQIFYNFNPDLPLRPLSVENIYFAVLNIANIFILARKELLVAPPELSSREKEIIGFMAKGWANKQIASELDLSDQTVRNHIHRIFKKWGVRNRVELLAKLKNESWV